MAARKRRAPARSRISASAKGRSKGRSRAPAPRTSPYKWSPFTALAKPAPAPSLARSQAPAYIPEAAYTKQPASWYRGLKTPRDERAFTNYLRDSLKDVRRYYKNFDSQHGYDLRKLKHWPKSRVDELRTYAINIHKIASGDAAETWVSAVPRSAAQRDALERHTGQTGTRSHPQKRWLVYTTDPTKTAIRYVKEPARDLKIETAAGTLTQKIPARLRMEAVRDVKGGRLIDRVYLFREVLGWQPGPESVENIERANLLGVGSDPWDQIRLSMRMLSQVVPSRISRGKYKGEETQWRVITERGLVGPVIPHHMLDNYFQDWADQYVKNTSFPGIILGLKYMGSEWQSRDPDNPNNAMTKAEIRRMMYKRSERTFRKARERIGYKSRGTIHFESASRVPKKKR